MPTDKTEVSPDSFAGKRVGINAHLLSSEAGFRRAGIHHYISQSLSHLPSNERGTQIILYGRHIAEPKIPGRRLMVHSRWPTERPLGRIVWEQFAWPWLARRHRLDLLHGMAFVTPVLSPCPTVVTVYDLSFVRFPERFPAMQRLYLASQTARSCRHARRVIAISESTRADVHRFYKVSMESIDVVHPGVDEGFRQLPAAEVASFRQREGLPERFILHVGTLQPRKNVPLLLDALAKVKNPSVQLFLVGGKGWLYDEIFDRVHTLGLQERVHFAGYVADGDLPLWYNAATLLIFPSVYEGFGMPVVEAMACGTPVIAANTSSIPEATGGAAQMFDPYDSAELADRIVAVLDDPHMAATMREQGLLQARRFSWERTGQETAAIYRKALLER
jgi:glycosyltransferase involved in cell wall biosynthesis